MMEEPPSNETCLISNTKTLQERHFERIYRIPNSVALHLLCQKGKNLKYLKSFCKPAKIWIPHTDDWKFDININRDIMIKGNSKEEVDNAEKIINTFIRNKTGQIMVQIQFSGSPRVQAEILTDLKLDDNFKNALRHAKQIIQWKFPETNIEIDIDSDNNNNKIAIKSPTLMLAEVAKGIIKGTFKDEFGLELKKHNECKKCLDLQKEYCKIKTTKEKHEAEISNLQVYCRQIEERKDYWKIKALRNKEKRKRLRSNDIAGEYVEDTTDEKKPMMNGETEAGRFPITCVSPSSVKENQVLKERLQTLEELLKLRDAEIMLMKNY